MYVHLSDAAVVPGASLSGEFGRVENTRGPVHAEQIRPVVRQPRRPDHREPVIDLNEHIDVESYEIRGRLREQTIWPTRPACSPGAPDPPVPWNPTNTTPTATTGSPTPR